MFSYIALLRKDDHSDYSVDFPDLPGCVTAGKTLDEAREFAREALALHLKGLAEDGDAIPAPSPLDAVMSDPENADAVAFLVDAPPQKHRAIPVTITVAADLVELVKAKSAELGMSQSGLFAAGVRQYLDGLSAGFTAPSPKKRHIGRGAYSGRLLMGKMAKKITRKGVKKK
jgi:predicted RNase H-like HicB family nuclease